MNLEEKQINLTEESNKNYRCNQSEFTTFYKKGLKIHKNKMHKVYTCADCDKFLIKSEILYFIHATTHTQTVTRIQTRLVS